ncbi:alginate O-acetyltransferase AlgX-related protein [Undibacterium sp. SXout7W]|uniref:alginate O-acetyltransferase AlgX-related protein n=1 Tax=Undibacterium sp. SXout7W TaxID=3413049 RepID=UPI003BF390DE
MTESFTFDMKKAGWMRFIPAVSFASILVAGFAVTMTSLRDVAEKDWAGMSEPRRILEGESTRRFSTQLNSHFLLSKPFAHIERAVTWGIAGDTGTSVRTGCDGWLFLADELTPYPAAKQNALARADIVTKLDSVLKKRGIQLVMAVVPDKSRIEHSHLCGLHRSPGFADRVDDWITPLRQQKIEVIDLRVALNETPGERYYRTDSHWNESGADSAARAIAQRLQALHLVDKPASPIPSGAIQSRMVERSGDLIRVANFDGLPAWLRPPADTTQQSTVAPVSVASDDLFGDTGLPTVALVGTSFARASNFVPLLSQFLGAPVANMAKDGGDFEGSAMAYLSSKAYQKEPPKVLLWEVPERMLQKPLTRSEQIWSQFLSKNR